MSTPPLFPITWMDDTLREELQWIELTGEERTAFRDELEATDVLGR